METFEHTCPAGHLILMDTARYGRMRKGHCVSVDHGHIGCSQNVLREGDALCSGRQTCSFKVPHDLFYQQNPCPKDVTPYLEAGASCVPGQ